MKRSFILTAALAIVFVSCKKNDPATNIPDAIQLPASVMVYNTYDAASGTTVQVLDGETGAAVTQYKYPAQTGVTWSHSVMGNGLLYCLDNKTITAIEPAGGKILWKDVVDNVAVPILHENVFYAVDQAKGVYALDATKATAVALWSYKPAKDPLWLNYANGLLFVVVDQKNLSVLDAKTGALQWQKTFADDYDFASLSEGLIIAGNTLTDAATGQEIATVAPVTIPPSFNAQNTYTGIAYANKDLVFVKTRQYDRSPGLSKFFLSGVSQLDATEKWRIDFGGGNIADNGDGSILGKWNGRLLTMSGRVQTASRYGFNYWESYVLLDPGKGTVQLTLDPKMPGGYLQTYTLAGQTMYFYKRFEKTIYAYFDNSEPANYLFAVDMLTGKVKWDASKLLPDGKLDLKICVFTAGKAYSPFIQ